MALVIILFIIGLILIIKGGDVFVDASIWISEISGIPKAIIGATVVSFATTLPEMIVSFFAAAQGSVDMAIGNAVGSVTANLGLILGIAIVCLGMTIRRKDYLLKTVLMIGASIVIVISGFSGELGIIPSIFLMIIFIIAMIENIRGARKHKLNGQDFLNESIEDSMDGVIDDYETNEPEIEGKLSINRKDLIANITKFILGAVGIILGAQLLVDNGSELARIFGVPERIIGVTIIAVGTSLPEFVTTITAIVKKEGALSIGNILGANIIDLTLILPICALISGQALPISPQSAAIDLPACLIIAVLSLIPTLIFKKFYRIQGVLVLACYVIYLLITTGFIAF